MDVPFDYVPIATWTAIETNSAIVVACLMTLKPFLSRHLPMLLGSSGPGDSSGEKEHVDAGHRILTIGSKPTRIPQRRSWEVFHSRTGPEETDLEDAGHQPMESDATLEAVKGSVSSASKCMEDTTTIPNG